MTSTDQNLNHPNQVDTIQLMRIVESIKYMQLQPVTQDFYDRIAEPDPHTCYVITDAEDGRMYYGKTMIIPSKLGPRYFLSQDRESEYILYVNDRSYNRSGDHLLEVCRFDDVNKALETMRLYNRVGSHASNNLQIYKTLINYINEELSIDEAILSVLVIMGYKEQPEFQSVVQFLVATNAGTYLNGDHQPRWRENLTPICSEELKRRAKVYPGTLYEFYNSVYEIFVKYNFFKSKVYKDEPTLANLSDPIDDIITAFARWRFGPLMKP